MEEYPAAPETEDHAHPHRRSDPGDPPAIGIVGAGAVGTALGAALARAGQAMVHTSGALGADVLEPALAAGTQIGAFHPLVAFADTERAIAALHGATVAIEGDEQLAALLARMAEAVGATAVRL